MKSPRILGLSASLRNARFGNGSGQLIEEIKKLETEAELKKYLQEQTQFRFDDFLAAGRESGKSYDQIYAQLRKLRGERGLSNSEAALSAAFWGVIQEGCEAKHVSLANHFPMSGAPRDLESLKKEIMEADAIILSGPVYFGDRGSLAQSFIELLTSDSELAENCNGKVFAGLSVGAKRNGGQETTLIYQLLDMVNLNFLVVGNSSKTTSQYGGTAVAGDVGKLHEDDYGIDTCIGTGKRVGHVASLVKRGGSKTAQLKGSIKLQLWLLQDNDDHDGEKFFQSWAEKYQASIPNLEVELINITKEEVVRCIACDLCPTHPGPVDEYRCIITSKTDAFVKKHKKIIEADAVLLCAYSPEDKSKIHSIYQKFIERTRYLRRDNYVFTDRLCAPFIVSELSARQNLHLRMLTSAIRHHTIIHHPLIAMRYKREILQLENLEAQSISFIETAKQIVVGRYLTKREDDLFYNPVGYEISRQKNEKDLEVGVLRKFDKEAREKHDRDTALRLEIKK